jgi:hypothetical protein
LILLASAPPAASRTGAGDAARAKFADLGFSALFPSEPQAFTHSDPQKTRPDSYLLMAGRGVYFVAALAHPAAERASQPSLRERFFDGVQRGTLDLWKKGLKADFIYQREISLGAHRGREFAVESPRYAGVLRMYLTGRRFYAVAFFHYNDAPLSREGERFLDSFEIDEP